MDARSVFGDRSVFVKLRPEGFEFHGEVRETIEARFLERPEPVRKLFEGGRLVCYAPDGEVSRSGRACVGCPDRGRCQPRLRLRGLTGEDVPFILELPPRAALRFLDWSERLEKEGRRLGEVRVMFRAVRTVGYPEIEFAPAEASEPPASALEDGRS
jgi:hypothetical protein